MDNYYNSIDELPIYNWWKVNETKDYTFLVKDKTSSFDAVKLAQLWETLYREFIQTFGVNESFTEYLELLRDIEILQLQKIVEDDPSKQTFIDIKEHELKELIAVKNTDGFDKTRSYVSKFIGFRIDDKVVSVKEYYGYIEVMREHAKANHGKQEG